MEVKEGGAYFWEDTIILYHIQQLLDHYNNIIMVKSVSYFWKSFYSILDDTWEWKYWYRSLNFDGLSTNVSLLERFRYLVHNELTIIYNVPICLYDLISQALLLNRDSINGSTFIFIINMVQCNKNYCWYTIAMNKQYVHVCVIKSTSYEMKVC